MPGRKALSDVARPTSTITSARPELDAVRVAAAEIPSFSTIADVSRAVHRWVSDAFRHAEVQARVFVPDRRGSLRLSGRSIGPARSAEAEDLSALRRTAFSSKQPVRAELAEPPSSAIVIPLVAGRDGVGVLEVVADRGEIEPRWGVLDCLASLAAIALRSVSQQKAAEEDVGGEDTKTGEWEGSPATPSAAWMAHEIRTPLIVARATVERVIATEPQDENQILLQRSHAHLERLMETVDRILDWACGGLTAGRHPVELAALARSAADAASAETGADRISVSAPDRMTIIGDEARLSIAITNLIRNALKYSPEGSAVVVTLERSGTWASLRVDDAGPGVREDERELIFAPLVRGRAGREDDTGRGLGLFMARQAVEELGGRIWVESNGAGSSFRILIPVAGKGEVPN